MHTLTDTLKDAQTGIQTQCQVMEMCGHRLPRRWKPSVNDCSRGKIMFLMQCWVRRWWKKMTFWMVKWVNVYDHDHSALIRLTDHQSHPLSFSSLAHSAFLSFPVDKIVYWKGARRPLIREAKLMLWFVSVTPYNLLQSQHLSQYNMFILVN